jgi:peptide-methionine (S)-S-oxide reductase
VKTAIAITAGNIVTGIAKATEFFPAEIRHQGYYRLNKGEPYSRRVIVPKLKKAGLPE